MKLLYKSFSFLFISFLVISLYRLTSTEESSDEVPHNENGNGFELSKLSSGKRELIEIPQDSIETDEVQIETEIEPKKHSLFVPTDEWQTIEPGQAIPRGCHVRIDFQTGTKEAKWAEERSTHEIQPTPNETDRAAISLYDDTAKPVFKSAVNSEDLNKTLSILASMDSSDNETYILLCLDELEQLLSDGDLAQYVTSTDHFSFLISLLHSQRPAITSATCLVIGSMWQNNQLTQLTALERNPLSTLIDLFGTYRDSQIDPSPVLFAISTLLRGLPYGMGMQYFTEFDLAHVLTELVANDSNNHRFIIKVLRLTTFLLDEYATEMSDDAQLAFKRNAMIESLSRAGYCLAMELVPEEEFPLEIKMEMKGLTGKACVAY